MDSLVLGEKQILGQLKNSVDRARELGLLSKYFNILTNIAIRTGNILSALRAAVHIGRDGRSFH